MLLRHLQLSSTSTSRHHLATFALSSAAHHRRPTLLHRCLSSATASAATSSLNGQQHRVRAPSQSVNTSTRAAPITQQQDVAVPADFSAADATAQSSPPEQSHYRTYKRLVTSQVFLPKPRVTRTPRALMSTPAILNSAGILRTTQQKSSSATASSPSYQLLPLGSRVLNKIERVLHNELAPFNAQRIRLHSSEANKQITTTHGAASYPASLASSISACTSLIADEFRQGRLTHAAFDIEQQVAQTTSSLWSAPKTMHDIALFHTRHADGIESYHSLVESYRLAIAHTREPVHVIERKPSRSGLAGVDADLAHEFHVPVQGTIGSGNKILKCTHCDYAATPSRALSISTPTTANASNSNQTIIFPPAINESLKSWSLFLLEQLFLQRVINQLQLKEKDVTSLSSNWKVELLFDPTAADDSRLLHVVLLRADHEVNIDAVCEHVSSAQLQRIATTEEAHAILRQFRVEQYHSGVSVHHAPSFSSQPELLIDQALIPDELDLDMEVIDNHEQEEMIEEQQQVDEEDEKTIEAAAAATSEIESDPRTLARMERGFASAASKLQPGETIDMVQLEMQSKGLDVAAAKAKLHAQAIEAQKSQHALNEQEEKAQVQLEELQQQVDQDESAPLYDPALEAETDPATPAAASSPSTISALIPHFEYSKQGFFRYASPHETCAVCQKGKLELVHTHVLANTTFVGRQELEIEEDEEEEDIQPIKSSKYGIAQPKATPKSKKKRFLHTSYGRFSSHDFLAHLALKNLQVPSPPAASIPTVYFPPLVASYQIVLIPVTKQEMSDPLQQKRRAQQPGAISSLSDEDDALIHTVHDLHDSIIDASLTPSDAARELDLSFPSLEGEILINDDLTASTASRIEHTITLGVPIILLISSSSLAKGTVSLLLNKKGLPLEPKKLRVDRLPQLLNRMVESNYANMMKVKKEKWDKQIEKERAEEEWRKLQAQAEQGEQQKAKSNDAQQWFDVGRS